MSPFDWREFLVLAYELRNDTREGARRASLGRAYYYAYNLALEKAERLNYTKDDPILVGVRGGYHKKLWAWLALQQDDNLRRLSIEGSRMLLRRTKADYYKDAGIQNWPNEIQKQLASARTVERVVAISEGQQPPAPIL